MAATSPASPCFPFGRINLGRADRCEQNAWAAPIGSAFFWDYFLTPREIPLSAALLSMCNEPRHVPTCRFLRSANDLTTRFDQEASLARFAVGLPSCKASDANVVVGFEFGNQCLQQMTGPRPTAARSSRRHVTSRNGPIHGRLDIAPAGCQLRALLLERHALGVGSRTYWYFSI